MITSFFPGRLRLRAPVFKNEEITAKVLTILQQSPAVTKVEHNPATGSVLLEYDPQKVPMNTLTKMVPFFKKLHKETSSYSEKKKPLILSMLNDLSAIVKSWKEETGT